MSDDPQEPVAALTSTPDPHLDVQRAALMKRAQFLNVQYAVLFAASLLLLVYNWSGGRTSVTTIAWAASPEASQARHAVG